MLHARSLVTALLLQAIVAGGAAATEYVLSTGVALPDHRAAQAISMAGMRRVMANGLFGEVALSRLPACPGGGAVSTLVYAQPRSGVRTGAGVLALRLPDQTGPARTSLTTAAGFQLGCGLQLPLATGIGVDVDARYVFMQRAEGRAAPDRFASRYWSLTLGIAIFGEK